MSPSGQRLCLSGVWAWKEAHWCGGHRRGLRAGAPVSLSTAATWASPSLNQPGPSLREGTDVPGPAVRGSRVRRGCLSSGPGSGRTQVLRPPCPPVWGQAPPVPGRSSSSPLGPDGRVGGQRAAGLGPAGMPAAAPLSGTLADLLPSSPLGTSTGLAGLALAWPLLPLCPHPGPITAVLPCAPRGASTQPRVTASGSPQGCLPHRCLPWTGHRRTLASLGPGPVGVVETSVEGTCVWGHTHRWPCSLSICLSVPLSAGEYNFGFKCVDCAEGTFSGGSEGRCSPWAE